MRRRPSARQQRAAGVNLLLIAAFTAMFIVELWLDFLTDAAIVPLVVGYMIFNFGFLYSVAKDGLETRGAKVGTAAVILNLLAMLMSVSETVWLCLSAAAVATSLVGAILLFRDAVRHGNGS